VEWKIVFVDFPDFKALRAQKKKITFYIYLGAICGTTEKKKIILLDFGAICS